MLAPVRRVKQLGPGIGRRFRKAREVAGITMRDLAAKAHVSRKTLQSISDGEAGNAGVGMLYDIAKALGVSPEWLAYGAGAGGPDESK